LAQDIVSLLDSTRRTIEALTKPPVNATPAANGAGTTGDALITDANDNEPTGFEPEVQVVAFKTAVYAFLGTLDSIDKRLKRQMYGLEEAGILSLAKETVIHGLTEPKPSLYPDGNGKIGGLDVGRLNAGGATVERDMERELWERASVHLDAVAKRQSEEGDVMMG
jgi:hypothetical protein